MRCVVMYCNVFQCVVVCCSVLQCVAGENSFKEVNLSFIFNEYKTIFNSSGTVIVPLLYLEECRLVITNKLMFRN